ncbi:MAG: hypothetical protein ACR2OF_07750 [Hyphomicrobium sp.]
MIRTSRILKIFICGGVLLISASTANIAAILDSDPLGRLAGRWTGEGVMTLNSGPAENFKCIVTYRPTKDGAGMRQNLRCRGRVTRLDAATLLWVEGTEVTGRWEDNINSINGTVHGIVTNDGFDVMLGGRFFAARMAVAGSRCEQMVTVLPERSVYFRELSAELRKC